MIKSLHTLTAMDRSQFGGKATTLGILLQQGINVPTGFVLSVDALSTYLAHCGCSYQPIHYPTYTREIRSLIESAELPQCLLEEIKQAYYKLIIDHPSMYYVVRSSALGEDTLHYSMAGMYESILDVTDFPELLLAIRKCWSSLFSDRSIQYMLDTNADLSTIGMGIIVQPFVPGNPSGVIFSVDPIEQNLHSILVNAADGPCAGFVNGTSPSVQYKLDKDSGILRDYPENGLVVPLSPGTLQHMWQTTLFIEDILGKGQDIEWTLVDGELYVLQARPITTLRTGGFPISWALPQHAQQSWVLRDNKTCPPLLQELVLASKVQFAAASYQSTYAPAWYGESIIVNGYHYFRQWEFEKADRKRMEFFAYLDSLAAQGQHIHADIIVPRLQGLITHMQRFLLASLTPQDAVDFLDLAWEYLRESHHAHWICAMGRRDLDTLADYCRDLGTELSPEDLYDLVHQPSLLIRERAQLLQLATMVKGLPVLNSLFCECPYNDILWARLQRMSESSELLAGIQEYLGVYGMCDAEEGEFLLPVLQERPARVLHQIRAHLELDFEQFQDSLQQTQKNKYRLIEMLTSPLEVEAKEVFLSQLRLAEKAFLSTDDHHYYIERLSTGYLRLAMMAAGRILQAQGLVNKPEDLHFLYTDEIKQCLLQGTSYGNEISDRKQQFQVQKRMLPPSTIGEQPAPSPSTRENKQEPSQKDNPLRGLSGLRKKASGKVYKAYPGHFPTVLTEDTILVLPIGHFIGLDVYPLLNQVKGMIIDRGSPFDHLGIMAREMDIPVIYNTGNALSKLTDGEEVELDGFTGIISRSYAATQ